MVVVKLVTVGRVPSTAVLSSVTDDNPSAVDKTLLPSVFTVSIRSEILSAEPSLA